MLVSLQKILQSADRGNWAVGAFNVNNLEIMQAIVRAAERMRSPVILQTSEGGVAYGGMEELVALMRVAAKKTRVPIAVHLDHGKDPDIVKKAIHSGYTSVMFDGSALPYEENVRQTRAIVRLAHRHHVSVEAELGSIAGIEDFVGVKARDAHLTDPEQAYDFIKRTGCDALAIAIGTAHGVYKFKGTPRLDMKRLQEINRRCRIPLVLHGASGIPHRLVHATKQQCSLFGDCDRLSGARGVSDSLIRQAVRNGIDKINIDSDLRIAFTAAVRATLIHKKHIFDPREILSPARDLMQKVVEQKMKLFGSAGKMSSFLKL